MSHHENSTVLQAVSLDICSPRTWHCFAGHVAGTTLTAPHKRNIWLKTQDLSAKLKNTNLIQTREHTCPVVDT